MGKINFIKFNRFRRTPRPIKEAFWEKVDIRSNNECWEWLAGVGGDGYGKFKNGLAHRFAWELSFGNIPKGNYVCHKCDNPPCCNPEHLFLGEQIDNMRDMVSKGRGYDKSGENNPKAKLSENDVLNIYKMYKRGLSGYKISKLFYVSETQINYILRGLSWGHLWKPELVFRESGNE